MRIGAGIGGQEGVLVRGHLAAVARGNGGGHGGSRGHGTPGDKGGGKGGGQGERTPGHAGGRPFISYVGTHPRDDGPDPDGLDQAARMQIEELAINLILRLEPGLRRTPEGNPGLTSSRPTAVAGRFDGSK